MLMKIMFNFFSGWCIPSSGIIYLHCCYNIKCINRSAIYNAPAIDHPKKRNKMNYIEMHISIKLLIDKSEKNQNRVLEHLEIFNSV